jgi:hypothetical protein
VNRAQFLRRVAGVALIAAVPEVLLQFPSSKPNKVEQAASRSLSNDIKCNSTHLMPGDIVRVSTTGEVMEVTSVYWGGCVVRRGIGRIVPHPIKRGTQGLIVGTTSQEGENIRSGKEYRWGEDKLMPRVFSFA